MASAHLFLISPGEEELLWVCSSAALQPWVFLSLYGYLPHRVFGITQGLGHFFFFFVILYILYYCICNLFVLLILLLCIFVYPLAWSVAARVGVIVI